MLNLREYAEKPRKLADFLPWACLPAPGVVLNKDGSFQKTYRYRGPDLESATEAELVAAMARVNNVLRRFGSGWALFFEANRHEAHDYPHSNFDDPASWLVEQERRLRFEETGDQFESTYYLTLLWLPPIDAKGRAEKALIQRAENHDPEGWRQRLESFTSQCDRAYDLLAHALQEIAPLDDGETLTYLHDCVSTNHHRAAVPEIPVFLDAILASENFTGGLEPMLGASHLRTLSILGFPATTLPGILDDLNRQGFEYRWSTRFIAIDKHEAEKVLNKQRRHWFAKRKSMNNVIREVMFNEQAALVDNDADNKALDADQALQELGSDLVSYGYVTTTVTVSHPDRSVVEAHLKGAEQVINGRGFTAIRENLNGVDAWLGSLPGHVYANVRQPVLHTLNLAHMTPLSSVWAGESWNRHLNAPALLQGHTHATTPFRLNMHVSDVGHSLIVGPTDAGKSVLLSLMAMQWRRYEHAQIFIFDKKRGARSATLAMGGLHIDLGGEDSPALQPLRNVDNPITASFAAGWLADLVTNEGVVITPDKKEAIWSAVQSLASAEPKDRTITGLAMLIQNDELKSALQPYTLEGPHGRLLDANCDDLQIADTVCYEMEDLMASPSVVGPVLSYIFHRLEQRIDGRPTVIILDEAWLFLDSPLFASRIREWLKTLRSKNVSVIFATQSLSDIDESSITAALIESCPTRIFLPNPCAAEPKQRKIYDAFGLNDRQIEIISHATPKRDYYYQSPNGARVFELGLGPVALAFCGSSQIPDQKLMTELMSNPNTEFADAWLRQKELGWAADLMTQWPGATSQMVAAE